MIASAPMTWPTIFRPLPVVPTPAMSSVERLSPASVRIARKRRLVASTGSPAVFR